MKKYYIVFMLLVMSVSVLTGCGGQTNGTADSKIKVIKIAGVNDAKPFTYLDENGELSGYDGDVLQAINKKLPCVLDMPVDWQRENYLNSHHAAFACFF